MTQIILDGATLAKLNGLGEELEFRNEDGSVLGHFVPYSRSAVRPSPADGCPYAPEELQRMRNEKGGRPLSEIWRALGVK